MTEALALFGAIERQEVARRRGRAASSLEGGAAEYAVVAKLTARGLPVFLPAVDAFGVDMMVGLGCRAVCVQVKVTSQVTAGGYPHLQLKRNSYRRRADGSRAVRSSVLAPEVDVLVVRVVGQAWFVLPRDVVAPSGVVFGPRMEQWREAWDVFDAAE